MHKNQEYFKGVSRVFQGCYKSVSRMFQESFEGVSFSRVFSECFKDVTRVFQGCFKSVSRVYPEGFKDVSRKLKDKFSGVLKMFQALMCAKNVHGRS